VRQLSLTILYCYDSPLPSSLRFNLDESVDLQVLATQCPANLTGADLYALCSNATLTALRRQIENMEQQSRHPLVSYVMQPPFQPPQPFLIME